MMNITEMFEKAVVGLVEEGHSPELLAAIQEKFNSSEKGLSVGFYDSLTPEEGEAFVALVKAVMCGLFSR